MPARPYDFRPICLAETINLTRDRDHQPKLRALGTLRAMSHDGVFKKPEAISGLTNQTRLFPHLSQRSLQRRFIADEMPLRQTPALGTVSGWLHDGDTQLIRDHRQHEAARALHHLNVGPGLTLRHRIPLDRSLCAIGRYH